MVVTPGVFSGRRYLIAWYYGNYFMGYGLLDSKCLSLLFQYYEHIGFQFHLPKTKEHVNAILKIYFIKIFI